MSEVMEGEVVYSCSNAKPVPSLTNGNIGNREGTLCIFGYFAKLLDGILT
jgi:hypothetical protein